MTDQSVFNESETSVTTDTTTIQTNPFEDQLKGIVNEDGKQKYDSLPKALEGLKNSQEYIPQLKTELQSKEAENAALREQLARTEAVEDVVSRLSNQQAVPTENTTQVQGLDENAVKGLFNQYTQDQQRSAAQASNENTVNSALVNLYGEKAGEIVANKAAELGTTVQALQETARVNPQLVLAAFGQTKDQTSVTNGSVSIPAVNPTDTGVTAPEKSLLAGATSKEQAAFMRQIRDEVWAENGITGPLKTRKGI